MSKREHPEYYELSDPNQYPAGLLMTPTQYHDVHDYQIMDKVIFGSDEFRMYAYKIKRCPRMRSHDWTDCPYAHRGEKAQRRDPRRHAYSAVICPAFRGGRCHKGDLCEFSHGVFEYWLHPQKYRTRACNAGQYCERKVCFFAHSPEQLRADPKIPLNNYCNFHHPRQHHYYNYHQNNNCVYRPAPVGDFAVHGGERGLPMATSTLEEYPTMVNNKSIMDESVGRVEEFLNSLRALKLLSDYEEENAKTATSGEEDLPPVDWIAELINQVEI